MIFFNIHRDRFSNISIKHFFTLIIQIIMSSGNDLGSLMNDNNSTDDIRPEQLSGDQNASKSFLVSQYSGTKANFFLTVVHIMKNIVGAGVIALPFTVSALGYGLSLIMFAIVLILIYFGSALLLKAKNLSKHSNFSTIFFHIFRTKAAQIVGNATVCLGNATACIAYLSIIKQTVHSILLNYIEDQQLRESFWVSTTFIVIATAALQLPLMFFNKIERLRFLSFIGVTGILTYIGVLLVAFVMMMREPQRDWNCSSQMSFIGNDIQKMIIVLPNIILALSFQQNFFPFFKGLKQSRDEKMLKATLVALMICCLFYILIGNLGYCLFGNQMQSNFLLSFNSENTNEAIYLILNISFLTSVFFSFTLLFFGARNNFIAISKNFIQKNEGYTKQISKDNIEQIASYIQAEDREQRKRKAKIYFFLYTLVIFVIINVTAIFVKNLQDALSVVGGISSNSMSFIFPSLFYFMLIRIKKKVKKLHYFIAIVIVVFFIPFGIFAVVTQFLDTNG